MKLAGYKILMLLLIASSALAQTNTWTGAVDNDWHKSCNWSLNIIPACTHDVIIPGASNIPRITGIAHSKTLDIQVASGGHLELISSGGGILYVSSLNNGVCSGTPTDNSASGCCTPWGQTQSLVSNHSGYGITADANAVYAVGFHTPDGNPSSGIGNEWYLQRRTLNGTFTHSASYGSANTAFQTNQDIAYRVKSDGTNIYVAGTTLGSGWRMEKRNASDLLSPIGVNSTTGGTVNIHDAVIDNASMYIVGFETVSGNVRWRIEKRNLSNCALAATWTRDFTNNANRPDIAYGTAVDATHLYVIGGTDGLVPANNDGRWRIEKIDKSTGTSAWSVAFDPSNGGGASEPGLDVAVDATGVYVAGLSLGSSAPSTSEIIIQKRDLATGSTILWSQAVPAYNVVIGGTFANLDIDATGLYITLLDGAGMWKVEKRSLTDGSLICTSTASAGVRASDIAVVNGEIYVVGSVPNQFRVEKMCCN